MASNQSKIFVVIPAYNEERTIGQVIDGVKKYVDNVIVIDDGSEDGTYGIAKKKGITVYQHIINLGLGGALGTGIKAALNQGVEIILTFDADGQHNPQDIPRMIEPILEKEADIVIGSRMLFTQKMPLFRKIAIFTANLITYLLFGIWTSDSQSGLRCFNKKTAQLINLNTTTMEVSSEIIKEIATHKLKLKEIPIESVYTQYSLSKGQGLIVGLKTLAKLIILKLSK